MSKIIFKYKIGQRFTDNKRDIEIVSNQYVKGYIKSKPNSNVKVYHCRCYRCGESDFEITEWHLNENRGCPTCNSKKVSKGINDVNTTAPWIKSLLKNLDDGYKHTKTSTKKITFVCPYCSNEVTTSLANIYKTHRVPCKCSDGISYPNKFIYKFLDLYEITYEREKIFDWSNNKKYDIFIILPNNKTLICENHGGQHYYGGFKTTKEFQKENDSYKRNLAKDNKIDYYIEIDCSISDANYIYNSILRTELCNLLNITPNSDFIKMCDEYANKNILKEICDIKKYNPNITASEVEGYYNLDHTTILRYWKKGANLGWCCVSKKNSKIINMFKDNLLIGTFDSAKDICNTYNKNGFSLCEEMIKRNCRNEIDNYKGYRFQYA